MFLLVVAGQDLRHLGRYDQKDRCSGMYKAGIDGDTALRAVFSSLVGRPRMLVILAGMDQNDICSGMYKAGVAGDNAPRAVFSFLVRRSMMRGIMAGIDQNDSCDMVPTFRLLTVDSPQLQFIQVVDISFVAQRQSLMVQTVRRTTDAPQLLYTVIDVPAVQVEQVHFPVVAQRQVPWSKLFV